MPGTEPNNGVYMPVAASPSHALASAVYSTAGGAVLATPSPTLQALTILLDRILRALDRPHLRLVLK